MILYIYYIILKQIYHGEKKQLKVAAFLIGAIEAYHREMTFEIRARFNDAAHYSCPVELIVFV